MSKAEKERAKAQQEKFQAILSNLLKDDDNKYCVDCDAKGPRWASWNLGIFLCIRCAGIHRNLGVHISKVKSVNLDSWTAEQVAMMMEIGNSRARAVYEANIPDNFRRPQSDSALEAFIRSKYEQKKYIAREWVPPKPSIPKQLKSGSLLDDDKGEKKKKSKQSSVQLSSVPKVKPVTESQPAKSEPSQKSESKTQNSAPDLLGLDSSPVSSNAPPVSTNNLLGDLEFLSAPTSSGQTTAGQTPESISQTSQIPQSQQIPNGSTEPNLFDESANSKEQTKNTKDSIMALFGSSSSQPMPQQFGVPGGMYMPQANMPMYGNPGVQQTGMMNPGMQYNQQGMMAMQPNMYSGMSMPGNMAMNQPPMYTQQPQMQQMQYQQMQQQMSQMRLGSGNTGMMGQPVGTAGGINWGSNTNNGHTLSTNLWK